MRAVEHTSLEGRGKEPLESVGQLVPLSAHGCQRFVMMEPQGTTYLEVGWVAIFDM